MKRLLKRHSSGHHYFSLKDEQASIPAVLFRYEAMRLRFRPENGMKVVARGRVSSFPRTGQVQLYVSELLPDGVGALQVAFDQLKARLQKEGLISSLWQESAEGLPPRKYYSITDRGMECLAAMEEEWGRLLQAVEELKGGVGDGADLGEVSGAD